MSDDEQLFCDGPGLDGNECGRAVAGHGDAGSGTPKCEAHLKQLWRTGKMVPIAEKLTPLEKAMAAMADVLEADSDDDYDTAVRNFALTSKGFGAKERSEAIKRALAEVRAKGVRLGRPPKTDRGTVLLLYVHLGASVAARELGVSRTAVYRAIARGAK